LYKNSLIVFIVSSIAIFKLSFNIILSNFLAYCNSSLALFIRFFICSLLSVERLISLFSNSLIDGGFIKIANEFSGYFFFILIPPTTSTSKTTEFPFSQILSNSEINVP